MTEDEAKTKWCPMVRIQAGDSRSPANNRTIPPYSPTPYARCIASECMMWREHLLHNHEHGKAEVHGFCGLAGRPLF